MTPEQWRRIQDLFARALALDAADRDAFLDDACASSPDLRVEVDSLLSAHERSVGFTSRERPLSHTATSGMRAGDVVDGKYRVDTLLGTGGMGAVYVATHVELERTVALKMIRAERLGEPSMAERFRREAVAVARLRHLNIVTVYDYGVSADAGAYLVMEYLRGRSLRVALGECERLDVREALDVVGQTCAAIAAAHAAGILHRDIKPENVFLEFGPRGTTVKVLDFGLAQFVEGEPSLRAELTARGMAIGTPAYMSPEQAAGDEADARSDVYALGCVAYEALAGRPPFKAPTAAELLSMQIHEPPPALAELAPGLAPEIEAAVMRALAKSPDDRYPTATDFARALGTPASVFGLETIFPGGATAGGAGALTDVRRAEAPAATAVPTNVVAPMTRFVGRERELAEARERLAKARLVTLLGPGGIGKTRLAIEAATRAVGEFPDGVWLVELAALADPSLVAQAVGSALGVRDDRAGSLAARLEEELADKRTLLVLDNCEHLVDACARLAEDLLVAAPGLCVLATSREALGVPGEAVWLVPALDMAEPDDEASDSEAVALFADRAALARPDFGLTASNAPLVAELCQRLEGSPLAIELAAARVRVLSIDEILERLDDSLRLLSGGQRTAPPRQRAMRATLDWSWDLLADAERRLLRRLSVFVGGWSLTAAEAICGDERGRAASAHAFEVLDTLARLVDKSLVMVEERNGETRYRMLETIHEYAAGRLVEAEDGAPLLDRRDRWLLGLAERAEGELVGPNADAWLRRLDAEHDNLRAVLRRSASDGSAGFGIRVCAAISRFWFRRGYWSEGREWIATFLAREDGGQVVARGRALNASATLTMFLGDPAGAIPQFEAATALQRSSGDRAGLCRTLYSFANAVSACADSDRATALAEECLAIARDLGDRRMEALGLSMLGYMAERRGETRRGCELLEQSLAIAREQGRTHEVCLILFNLGQAAVDLREIDRAVEFLAESGEIAAEIGDRTMIAGARVVRGIAELYRGDPRTARVLFREGLAIVDELRTLYDIASVLEALSHAAIDLDDMSKAFRLAGAATALRERIGVQMSDVERQVHETYMARARAALPEGEAARAFEAGREMALDRAVAYALED